MTDDLNPKDARLKHVKLRLVYSMDSSGNPDSYICCEKSQSIRILRILKYINKRSGKITIKKLGKDLKMNERTLSNTLSLMAGTVQVDMKTKKDEPYEKLLGKVGNVIKELYNHKTNLSNHTKVPPYLRSPFYISRPTA